MDTDRRRFLTSAGALATLTACGGAPDDAAPKGAVAAPDRPPEPEPWLPAESVDLLAFAWGIQVGDVTQDAALLALRTTEAAVDLVLMQADGTSWIEVQRIPGLPLAEGHLAHELTGLRSDTAYTVVFVSGDRRSEATRFRTALPPEGHRKVVFAATSCLGNENPGWESLAQVAGYDPDFFLLLGDTVYADGATTLDDYRAEWDAALSNPSFRALLARTSVIATWDDHEVANNWVLDAGGALQATVTPSQLEAATQAFREALPMRVGPGGSGFWRSLSWGVVDVFALDCRGERSEGHLVSQAQLDWITAELAASTAVFKIVLASVHVTDHDAVLSTVEADDRWQGYPEDRDALIAALIAVPGVFVVTGDMHYGAIQRIDPAGEPGEDLYEIAAGPGGSEIFPFSAVAAIGGDGVPPQYETLVEAWSVCLFVADPGLGTLQVSFLGDDGAVIAEQLLLV